MSRSAATYIDDLERDFEDCKNQVQSLMISVETQNAIIADLRDQLANQEERHRERERDLKFERDLARTAADEIGVVVESIGLLTTRGVQRFRDNEATRRKDAAELARRPGFLRNVMRGAEDHEETTGQPTATRLPPASISGNSESEFE